MAKERDYKAEYAARSARAKQQTGLSYGQLRRQRHELKVLRELFPDATDIGKVLESPGNVHKKSRIDRLKDFGATSEMVAELYGRTDDDDFWQAYRSRYEALKMA